jgi:dTDP-4-dehydrorhamnose 3,5-epimerase
MKQIPTNVAGCFVLELEMHSDERGFFARAWDVDELIKKNLDPDISIQALTFNKSRGTLRGMHFQREPYAETKFVRVTRGAIFDVALDLRKDSPTYLKWHGEVLSAENRKQLYIPKGCAHGYLTLEDNTELSYTLSAPYAPTHAAGVRYNDALFGIAWPEPVRVINDRDANYLDHTP